MPDVAACKLENASEAVTIDCRIDVLDIAWKLLVLERICSRYPYLTKLTPKDQYLWVELTQERPKSDKTRNCRVEHYKMDSEVMNILKSR